MNLTPTLLNQIRDTLRDCGPFENDRQLRALFVDPRINPWRDRLPTHSASFYDLINDVINLLHTKRSADYNENGLILFLQVIVEQVDKGDACHNQILDLITELSEVALPSLPQPQQLTNLRIQLVTILETRFNESELKKLCLYIDVDIENLGGYSKADKARELILFMERRERLVELLHAGRNLRPDINWPPVEVSVQDPPPKPKPRIVTVMAEIGPLLFTMKGQLDKWQLQATNQGDVLLRKVTMVLRPSPTITVGTNRISLGTVGIGETVSFETPLIIRPNQHITGEAFSLAFDIFYHASEKNERSSGTFHIPVKEGESS